jgi:hypothetical protein
MKQKRKSYGACWGTRKMTTKTWSWVGDNIKFDLKKKAENVWIVLFWLRRGRGGGSL